MTRAELSTLPKCLLMELRRGANDSYQYEPRYAENEEDRDRLFQWMRDLDSAIHEPRPALLRVLFDEVPLCDPPPP